MTMQITNIRTWVLGLVVVGSGGCLETVVNPEHCWVAEGDKTCMVLFNGGFCSNDHPDCEGYEVPYGCVFERPKTDECYSPNGKGESCAGPNPAPECTEVAGEGESGEGESGEGDSDSGELETSDTSDTSAISECGDGTADVDEECDDGNDVDTDKCTNACTLPVCGDGVVSTGAGEACDDQNTLSGDLCKADCELPGAVIWESYSLVAGQNIGYEVEIDSSGRIDVLVEIDDEFEVRQFNEDGSLEWKQSTKPCSWDSPQTNLVVDAVGAVFVGCFTGMGTGSGRFHQHDADMGTMTEVDSIDLEVLGIDVKASGEVVVAGSKEMNAMLIGITDSMLTWNPFGMMVLDGEFNLVAVGGSDEQVRVWHALSGSGSLRLVDSMGGLSPQSAEIVEDATDGRAIDLDDANGTFVLTQSGITGYSVHKYDASGVFEWTVVQDTEGTVEGADGLAVLPGGGVLVAGYVETVSGQPHGRLTWFSPDGQDILNFVIDENIIDLTAQLYDVAISPDGDYAVAVGWRRVGNGNEKLWLRKFEI